MRLKQVTWLFLLISGAALCGENLSMNEALGFCNQVVPSLQSKSKSTPLQFERTQLTGDVAAYRIQLRIGAGEHDVIGLHRVVKEVHGRPVRSDQALFLVHGDLFDFESIFLASKNNAALPPEHAYALFLAQAGVDVWGIDRRWTQIPGETTDFSFLEDWDMAREVADTSLALLIARNLRFYTTGSFDRFILQGWSSGGSIAWALANKETKVPRVFRQVKALIPTDTFFTLPEGADVDAGLRACARLESLQGEIDGGNTFWNNSEFTIFSLLYQQDPDGASPFFPGYTNKQAFLGIGGFTYLLEGDTPFTSGYHFVGAGVDEQGLPEGLAFSDLNGFAGLIESAVPFQDKGTRLDMEKIVCGETASEHGDNLGQIEIPVFYVGAAGGFGRLGAQTLQLLDQAPSVSELIIQYYPDEYSFLDYGHADLFIAADAAYQVWLPILHWIEAL